MATVTVPPYLNMQEDVNGLHRAFKGKLPSHDNLEVAAIHLQGTFRKSSILTLDPVLFSPLLPTLCFLSNFSPISIPSPLVSEGIFANHSGHEILATLFPCFSRLDGE